jgi:dTDP-4-dehydrorhamnose 3,5-epimerase
VKFTETRLKGATIIDIEPIEDERGFFARSWCREEFEAHGLNPVLVQCSISFNRRKGTLRGLHYQAKPHEEAKLVRCTRGVIYDVILDLRPDSATSGQWVSVELSAENRRSLYVPEGCAHGFQALADNTEVFYQISAVYVPESARAIRWNDPFFHVHWPLPNPILSPRDRSLPDFKP